MTCIPVAGSRNEWLILRLARRVAMLAPLLLLPVSCGPAAQTATQPAVAAGLSDGDQSVAPSFTEREFIASDGTRLPLRKWLPQGPVKAAILALHGFNDYSNAFDLPAKLWAAHGIATYAYDQRGFGGAPGRGSGPARGVWRSTRSSPSASCAAPFPAGRSILLGESMGGAVAILAATGTMSGVIPGPDGMPRAEADGVILSAPAVWGRATMDLLPQAGAVRRRAPLPGHGADRPRARYPGLRQ